jgi:exodeoxyribonuclease-5
MELSAEQKNAIALIGEWFLDINLNNQDSKQFKLGGYAGTGKTTIIKTIIEVFKSQAIALCAFTGKAVSVLRKKGCPDAQTLHSLMYHCELRGTRMIYHLRDSLDFDLIVVDEASMISKELYDDLISFGIPILWVGDPGQLEPVGNDINLMSKPDVVLEQIHRQGEGSQILAFADAVRHHSQPCNWKQSGIGEVDVLLKSQLGTCDVDQFICGFNKTRVKINTQMRRQLGFDSQKINPSERLIILKNNKNLGLFNGMQLTVLDSEVINPEIIQVTCKDDLDQKLPPFKLLTTQLGLISTIDQAIFKSLTQKHRDENLVLADYGYCLTGHKSQGSEWDRVAVIEEIWTEKWSPSRWRYTTATRAAKKLFYFI